MAGAARATIGVKVSLRWIRLDSLDVTKLQAFKLAILEQTFSQRTHHILCDLRVHSVMGRGEKQEDLYLFEFLVLPYTKCSTCPGPGGGHGVKSEFCGRWQNRLQRTNSVTRDRGLLIASDEKVYSPL